MTTMPKVVPRVPKWKLEIFNTRWNWKDAKGTDIHKDRLSEYDAHRCGWLPLDSFHMKLFDVQLAWQIREKPTGTIKIAEEDSWLLGVDMITKAQAVIYFDQYVPDIAIIYPSHAIVYIDNTGIEDHYPKGTVSITGMVYDGPYAGTKDTETMRIDGPGIYITEDNFQDIYEISADMDDEGQGASCTMSVWAKRNTGFGIRECRLWCDTNGDGVYGLVFGGYICPNRCKVDNYYPVNNYALVGYAEFLQTNEYIAGYRADYRCSHFKTTGQYGSCDQNAIYFRAGGSSCYVGDWGTFHPSGEVVNDFGYHCPLYNPNYDDPLPQDGWTYDQKYAPETSPYYEYYPHTFFRALMALCNMANSLEVGKPSSRDWMLACKQVGELYEDFDNVYNIITLRRFGVPNGSRIIIENEVMKVIADGASTIGVERGVDKTLAIDHPKGEKIYCPKIAWATTRNVEPPLTKADQLQEANLKHTIQDTLDSLAENATTETKTTEYVGWVDCFKQIQFTALDEPCVGYDSHFVISVDDIVEDPSYCLSAVVNKISAQVNLTDTYWVYCEMSTNSSELAGYEASQQLFGIASEEISNVNLTALVPTEGRVDFQTFATKFLKLYSFPRLTETIVLDSFVPDEHYWQAVNLNDADKKPYLDYTDEPNKHINLLGTTLTAPDFFKPKDEDGNWQSSEFWVEGIKYESRVEGTREFYTTLILSRMTTPEEWS